MYKLASYVVREGALSRRDAIGWVVRLCTTLEIIHGAGSAHGRISARAIQVLGVSCDAAGFFLDTRELTDDVAYQSPARLKGRAPNAEDDAWACVVLLYVLLTGERPFSDRDAETTRRKVLFGAPPPLAQHGVQDRRLSHILDTSLARERRQPLSVAALRVALVACEPSVEMLAPLQLGRPNLQIFDDNEEDDEGDQLTAVMTEVDVRGLVAAAQAIRDAPAPTQPRGPQVDNLSWDDLPDLPDELPLRPSKLPLDVTPLAGSVPTPARAPGTPARPSAALAGGAPKRSRALLAALGAMLVTVGAGAALAFHWFQSAGAGAASASASASAATTDSATTASASESASAAASATAAASAAASGSAARATGEERTACMAHWIDRDSHGALIDLARVCDERHPHKGSLLVRAWLVRAARGAVSPGMKEWGQLGWYAMPLFASMRADCCASAPRLSVPLGSRACDIETPLAALARAAADDVPLDAALEAYHEAVTCLVRQGLASAFEQSRLPSPIERQTFVAAVKRRRRP